MRRHTRKKRIERLRLIVDTLPYQTRAAMLEGIEQFDIIAGAYSSRDGGVCPMLAAHRCGGRTDMRSFARAWDRFTGAGRARRASERELRTLAAQLESSLWNEDQARHAHRIGIEPESIVQLGERVRREPDGPAGSDSTPRGDAWLLPFRDLEEYARALGAAIDQIEERPAPERERQLETVS